MKQKPSSARQFAINLANRCRNEFKSTSINVGPNRNGSIYFDSFDRYYWFSLGELESKGGKLLWGCDIAISEKREVWVQRQYGKVPKDVIACAIG